MNNKLKPCGNKDCSVSTGICDSLTFGRGHLDPYGYWEFPCVICERKYYKEQKEINEKHQA